MRIHRRNLLFHGKRVGYSNNSRNSNTIRCVKCSMTQQGAHQIPVDWNLNSNFKTQQKIHTFHTPQDFETVIQSRNACLVLFYHSAVDLKILNEYCWARMSVMSSSKNAYWVPDFVTIVIWSFCLWASSSTVMTFFLVLVSRRHLRDCMSSVVTDVSNIQRSFI